ncbi:MAG TPA: UDP-N-acetylmuramoyl-tripeptide--D-alanyl-D-alanine ligase [Pseudonocardiaceae bacterium]|nr:UDP-N-acetylmuramoyl-tripeptide--D-alanyl-D-alanine ligase [Pseudonocardiaceae bacterium]
MIRLTLAEIAEIVGGRLYGATGAEVVTGGVEFDSRALGTGDLFVAMPGERVDGHDFAAAAIAKGAVGVLAAREVLGPDGPVPSVVVTPLGPTGSRAMALAGDSDGSGAAVLAAMAAIAGHVVRVLTPAGLTVVGVTGSAGKTSTKDLIAHLLRPLGSTVAPPESFNSELGTPWTVLRATEETRYLVLELSARGVGHIAAACRVTRPRIGAVLNVGRSHLGEFGSQQQIAVAKGELIEALPETGVAILNADDPLVAAMRERTRARVVAFGQSTAADVRAERVVLDEQARAGFELHTPQGSTGVQLGLHGAHQVNNALAAAAIAIELGADLDSVAKGLSSARPVSRRRMEVTTRQDGVTVVNDSYNASPEAVREALKTLATMGRSAKGRTWAVLGPMGELGEDSVAVHDEIGRLVVRLDISQLVVVGEAARPIHQGASLEGSWGEESVLVPDVDAAVALLRAELRPGDVVLVKAAKAARLWRIAEALLDPAGGVA